MTKKLWQEAQQWAKVRPPADPVDFSSCQLAKIYPMDVFDAKPKPYHKKDTVRASVQVIRAKLYRSRS
jgi:hypothetical protein